MRTILGYFVAVTAIAGGYDASTLVETASWPVALRAQMTRLAEVDWRLRIAARNSCPHQSSDIGITVDYREAYPAAERKMLYQSLRLGEYPQVVAVIADSPAASAGFKPGDEVLSLGEKSIAKIRAASSDSELLADDMTDMIGDLPANVPIVIKLRRGKMLLRKAIVPVTLCATRTVLKTDREVDAYGDSNGIAVTSALIDFTENDDELALVIGHELAHIILNDTPSSQFAQSQSIESAADILGATIGHCAGYDMKRAAAFWSRFESQDMLSRRRMGTHPSPPQREIQLLGSVSRLTCPVTLPQSLIRY